MCAEQTIKVLNLSENLPEYFEEENKKKEIIVLITRYIEKSYTKLL